MNSVFCELQYGRTVLQASEIPSFALESELLLAQALGVDRLFLKSHPETLVPFEIGERYRVFLEQRAKYRPFAYIVGYKHWGGLKISVDERVLIPRDETEFLLEYLKAEIRTILGGQDSLRILDIGTGSGCLLLGIGKYLGDHRLSENASLEGLDIDPQALEVAKINSNDLNIPLNLFESDLLEKIPEGAFYDLIVANLPYVPESLSVSPEVEQEPSGAIFVKGDGLELYRKLRDQLESMNIKFSSLWIEFLPSQKETIGVIFQDYHVQYYADATAAPYFASIQRLN